MARAHSYRELVAINHKLSSIINKTRAEMIYLQQKEPAYQLCEIIYQKAGFSSLETSPADTIQTARNSAVIASIFYI